MQAFRLATQKDQATNGQGPAHALYQMCRIIDVKCKSNHQRTAIYLHDANGLSLDLLGASKAMVRKIVTRWVRRAIIAALAHRVEVDEDGKPLDKSHHRKDMQGISIDIDISATTANFSAKGKKGGINFSKGTIARQELRSVLAGSIRAFDRLKAAGLIESDICLCKDCNGARHTTDHMFWVCARHAETRKNTRTTYPNAYPTLGNPHPLLPVNICVLTSCRTTFLGTAEFVLMIHTS